MVYTLAIDPGTTKSAWCVIDDLLKPVAWAGEENEKVLGRFYDDSGYITFNAVKHGEHMYSHFEIGAGGDTAVVIEDVTHMGMGVGKDVFETVRWSGRFDYRQTARFISRPNITLLNSINYPCNFTTHNH